MDREPLLWTQNLSVHYGATPALHDLTMPIYRGCITAIVGPSGCGKSTFLNCLNRMTDLIPDCQVSGTVTFDQVDVFSPKVNVQTLRRRIGMIFQKPNPFPLSIRKNLTFALKHHGLFKRSQRGLMNERVESALRDVGLWEEVKDRLDKPAMNLSGGQQQRLCLARALVLEPEVVLMDEPCSALDPIASGVVEELILSLRSRYTVVVVTHNLAQARRIADDAALFWVREGAGCLVERGAAQSLFERPQSELAAEYVSGVRA